MRAPARGHAAAGRKCPSRQARPVRPGSRALPLARSGGWTGAERRGVAGAEWAVAHRDPGRMRPTAARSTRPSAPAAFCFSSGGGRSVAQVRRGRGRAPSLTRQLPGGESHASVRPRTSSALRWAGAGAPPSRRTKPGPRPRRDGTAASLPLPLAHPPPRHASPWQPSKRREPPSPGDPRPHVRHDDTRPPRAVRNATRTARTNAPFMVNIAAARLGGTTPKAEGGAGDASSCRRRRVRPANAEVPRRVLPPPCRLRSQDVGRDAGSLRAATPRRGLPGTEVHGLREGQTLGWNPPSSRARGHSCVSAALGCPWP